MNEPEHRRDDGRKIGEQLPGRLSDLEIMEALFLHSLATSSPRHTFDGDPAKSVTAGKTINELWCEGARAENDELRGAEGNGIWMWKKLDEASLAIFQAWGDSGKKCVAISEFCPAIARAGLYIGYQH